MLEVAYAVVTGALQFVAWTALTLLVAGLAIGIRETLTGAHPGDDKENL